MEYKLGAPKCIHWDKESIYKIHSLCIIRWNTTAEIYAVHKGMLPIIIVAHPIILDKGITVFSSIINTKAILTFKRDEEPINDILKMWEECYIKEVAKFKEMGAATVIQYFDLENMEHSNFNSAYNLRGAAIERGLLDNK
jgi:hypothetical protein